VLAVYGKDVLHGRGSLPRAPALAKPVHRLVMDDDDTSSVPAFPTLLPRARLFESEQTHSSPTMFSKSARRDAFSLLPSPTRFADRPSPTKTFVKASPTVFTRSARGALLDAFEASPTRVRPVLVAPEFSRAEPFSSGSLFDVFVDEPKPVNKAFDIFMDEPKPVAKAPLEKRPEPFSIFVDAKENSAAKPLAKVAAKFAQVQPALSAKPLPFSVLEDNLEEPADLLDNQPTSELDSLPKSLSAILEESTASSASSSASGAARLGISTVLETTCEDEDGGRLLMGG
jgi:hypothetical protein